MDGDIAPLPELCGLAEKFNCIMMVDDAHASGVLGRNGRGTVDHLGCHGRVHIQVGTLSKAIGAMGGYVCGSRELVDFLYRRARPFLYSTGHPPSVVATCQAAIHAARFARRRKADQETLGQYEILSAPLEEAGLFHGRDANAHHSDPRGRRRESI